MFSVIKTDLKSIYIKILRLIGRIISPIYRYFTKSVLCVVNIEGGLASQLEQYTLGQLLKTKGYEVKYDLSSYKDGKSLDVLGTSARNLDINKLDKDIMIDELTGKLLTCYKRLFSFSEKKELCKKLTSTSKIKTPVYFGGYGYGLFSEKAFECVYKDSIHINYDINEFGSDNQAMLDEISHSYKSVAMHVRRGDTLLAKVGRPIAKKEYYLEALLKCDEKANVFIFSDDFDWVESELIPNIPNSERCTTVKINGSDRGWCDLILMAACHTQIKSPSGGLGREAFRLNSNEDARLIMPVYVSGNMCEMTGNITEIVLTDELCDMQYVKNKNDRL